MTLPAPTFEVWDEDGSTALGVAPALIQPVLSTVFCRVGSLKFSLPRGMAGETDLLDPTVDRQIRIVQPGQDDVWVLVDEDSYEAVSDDSATEPVEVTCRSLAAVLDEAVVYPSGGAGSTPAEYAFTTPTPGDVVADLITQAQGRGLVQGVTLVGDGTADADAAPWDSMPSVTYKAGTTLLTVLTGLADQQLLEWRMAGRSLEIYVPGGGLDRSLDLALRPRREVTSALSTNSRRSVVTDVLVEGESSSTAHRSQSLAGRRKRETYLSQTSAPSGSLNALGDLFLEAHTAADSQLSHKLTDSPGSPAPGADYRCGDRVLTPAAITSVTRRRIQQIAVDWDAGEVTVELGTLLASEEDRFAAALARLLPGESSLT